MKMRTAMFWAVAAMGVALSFTGPAAAQTAQERRTACSDEWSKMKDAGKVPAGQTWSKFYSECNARLKAAEGEAKPAQDAKKDAKAKETTAKDTKPKDAKAEEKAADSGKSRQQQCSAEWKAAKDAGKIPAGQTWPKFYSECNARLSGAAPASAPAAKETKADKQSQPKPAAASTAAETSGKSRQQQCSAEWKAAKDAGKIPAGQTWPKFYSECNARLSGAAPASAPAAKETKADKEPQPKPAAASSAVETSGKSRQQQCSAEWKAAKDAGKIPAGQTWPKFYSECNARLSGAEEATPPDPSTATADEAPKTRKDGREPTAGEIAFQKRISECGSQWKAAKAAGKVPNGQTWPQYWSACNTRLKAAGQ